MPQYGEKDGAAAMSGNPCQTTKTLISRTMIVLLILTTCLISTSGGHDLTAEILQFFRSDVSSALIWDHQLRILPDSAGKHHQQQHVRASDLVSNNVSQRCVEGLARVATSLKDGHQWAYRFIDSSAKTPAGLLDGTVSSFGDYDECLDIRSPTDELDLWGKHCLLKFTAGSLLQQKNESGSLSQIASEVRDALYLFDTFTLNLGFCVPSSCDANDLRFLLSPQLEASLLKLHPDPIFCDTHESNSITFNKLSLPQLISMLYLTAIICLVYLATIMDLLNGVRLWRVVAPEKHEKTDASDERKTKKRFRLRFFSLSHNMNQMIAQPTHKREGSVDDMRFLLAGMATVLHAMSCAIEFRAFAKILRLRTDFYDKFTWFSLQPFINLVGIEGFFCIS